MFRGEFGHVRSVLTWGGVGRQPTVTGCHSKGGLNLYQGDEKKQETKADVHHVFVPVGSC